MFLYTHFRCDGNAYRHTTCPTALDTYRSHSHAAAMCPIAKPAINYTRAYASMRVIRLISTPSQ